MQESSQVHSAYELGQQGKQLKEASELTCKGQPILRAQCNASETKASPSTLIRQQRKHQMGYLPKAPADLVAPQPL